MMSQGGKTAGALNVALARLDDDPAKVLYVGPTKTNVTKVIQPKIDEALRNCPSLWAKVVQGKKYTSTKILVAGVSLRLAWAGSPVELAADDAALVLVDELDRMDRNIRGEGSAIDLADARHSSYLDGKTVIFSTPTEGQIETEPDPLTGLDRWKYRDPEHIGSQIWAFWQDGTRHECAAPCAECRAYFIPRLSLLDVPEDASPEQARREARVACPHCGAALDSDQIRWSIPRCVYVAPGQRPMDYRDSDAQARLVDFTASADGSVVHTVDFGDFSLPAGATSDDATFWVSGLLNFSAKNTIAALAAQLVKARRSGDPERVKSVVNTKFGECYAYSGDAPKWEEVRERIVPGYVQGEVPAAALQQRVLLTAGLDVQKRYIAYVVRAWVAGLTSWLIEEGELLGDTSQPEMRRQVSDLLTSSWSGLPLARACIDSGYRSNEVYLMARTHPRIAIATKGRDRSDKPFWTSLVDVDIDGKTLKGGQELWLFNTDVMKSWVHSRITWPADEAGAWHLPTDVSDDYCKEIVGEYRMPSSGVWVRTGPNHKLDCEALAYLAIRTLGGRERSGPEVSSAPPPSESPPPSEAPARSRPRRRVINRGVTL